MVARTGGSPRAPDTDNPCTLIGYFLPAKISVPLPMVLLSGWRAGKCPIVSVSVSKTSTGVWSVRSIAGDELPLPCRRKTYRLWEGTGTAHADSYDVAYFGLNTATQEPFYPPPSLRFPFKYGQ
jgi:hypothetical protein